MLDNRAQSMPFPEAPLESLIESGDLEATRKYLEADRSPQPLAVSGDMYLFKPCRNGDFEMVKLLRSFGAAPQEMDSVFGSFFEESVFRVNVGQVDCENGGYPSPLLGAIYGGHFEIADFLIRNSAPNQGVPAEYLEVLLRENKRKEALYFLQNCKLSPKKQDRLQSTLIEFGDTALFDQWLNSYGLQSHSTTALAESAEYDRPEITRSIIRGATRDIDGQSSLHAIICRGAPHSTRVLFEELPISEFTQRRQLRSDFFGVEPERIALLIQYGVLGHKHLQRAAMPRNDKRYPALPHQFQHKKFLDFFHLVDRVATYGRSPQQVDSLLKLYDLSLPTGHKSDALQRSSSRTICNIASVLLWAGYGAYQLGDRQVEFDFRDAVRTLVEHDIERIERTKGMSYRKYADELTRRFKGFEGLRDVVDEVAGCVYLPAVSARRKYYRFHSAANAYYERAKLLSARAILQGKTSLDLISLNHRWHRPGNRIPSALQPLKSDGEWHALFKPVKTKNGFSVICLNSSKELQREGDALRHCVGGASYDAACRKGDVHIISIQRDGERLATIELCDPDVRGWRTMLNVAQFKGRGNGLPPTAAIDAWNEVSAQIETGQIALSDIRGITKGGKKSNVKRYHEQLCGFPLKEIETYLPQILKHYAERMVIQRGNRKDDRIALLGGGIE